ncbi:Aste57867_9134 [Aphanomyces stellatus]|uniref:Aste57867_9134 protein n=1 Tax=Aphanomyces stellatus TaxID=120398 RepID=A0A485KMB1_9STRA|nr:hypothetical protein As57867_009098 [Aphanomyces stellatus]VFT86018.1 Aste57867_9134 [Aphanomyces stellatus]
MQNESKKDWADETDCTPDGLIGITAETATETAAFPNSIMGSFVAKLRRFLEDLSIKRRRILLLGLDAVGKTTILYHLRLQECVRTIPTIGFNVETFTYKAIEFTAWDIGVHEKARALWRHYYPNTDAIVFVVDSNDRDRMEEATGELHRMMANEADLRDAKLLVYANKQDLPHAMPCAEMVDAMRLHAFTSSKRKWTIQPCTAVTGEGLFEGLEWLRLTLE